MSQYGILIRVYNRVDEAAVAAELIHRFFPEGNVVVVTNDVENRFPLDSKKFPHVGAIYRPPSNFMTVPEWDGETSESYDYKNHVIGDGDTIREGSKFLLALGCRYQLMLTADAWILGREFLVDGFQRLEKGAVWVSSAWTELGSTLAYDVAFYDGEYVNNNEIWPCGAGHKTMPAYYGVNITEKWLYQKFRECGALTRVHVLRHVWPIHPEYTTGKKTAKWKYVEHERGEWKRRGFFPEVPMVTYHADRIGGIDAKKRLANRCVGKEIFASELP